MKPKFEVVLEFIQEKIASGEWKPGDRLPSQSRWDAAGVKYGTLRPALLILKSQGLIYGHQGDGLFINGGDPAKGQQCRLPEGRLPGLPLGIGHNNGRRK